MVVENRLRRLEEDVVEIAVDQLVIITITVISTSLEIRAVFVVEDAVVIVCEIQWGWWERDVLSSWRAWRWSGTSIMSSDRRVPRTGVKIMRFTIMTRDKAIWIFITD